MSEYKKKFVLDEERIPKAWYNISADLPSPRRRRSTRAPSSRAAPTTSRRSSPEHHRAGGQPERYIEIPDEVREIYPIWRPTPLIRATGLEKALDTPAKIYYKYEGVSPAGSHKPNTAVAQAYYNKMDGTKRLATETGAGQWGSALAMACKFFGLECKVYMVKVSYHQKPYRRMLMQTWGAQRHTPARATRRMPAAQCWPKTPTRPAAWASPSARPSRTPSRTQDTKYSLGSVLNHVLLHQTVIGQEAMKQMEMAGEYPDVVIGCVGGGSNFAGIAFPFMRDKLDRQESTRLSPSSRPPARRSPRASTPTTSATRPRLTPLLKMYTLGHNFMPAGIHAGGLRYHGMAPMVSHLSSSGMIEAVAYHQSRSSRPRCCSPRPRASCRPLTRSTGSVHLHPEPQPEIERHSRGGQS